MKKYTTVKIPAKLVQVWSLVYYDWELFGTRINSNIEALTNNEGFVVFEIPKEKFKR